MNKQIYVTGANLLSFFGMACLGLFAKSTADLMSLAGVIIISLAGVFYVRMVDRPIEDIYNYDSIFSAFVLSLNAMLVSGELGAASVLLSIAILILVSIENTIMVKTDFKDYYDAVGLVSPAYEEAKSKVEPISIPSAITELKAMVGHAYGADMPGFTKTALNIIHILEDAEADEDLDAITEDIELIIGSYGHKLGVLSDILSDDLSVEVLSKKMVNAEPRFASVVSDLERTLITEISNYRGALRTKRDAAAAEARERAARNILEKCKEL